MADNQVSNGTASGRRKSSNKTSGSRNDITENSNDGVEKVQDDLVVLDSDSGTDSGGEEEEAKRSDNKNEPTADNADVAEDDKDGTTADLGSSRYGNCKFPMNRISRIIKSEDPNMRITQEAVFLINKSSEKFLELFSKEAYACAVQDGRRQVEYKHLSTVVGKRRRFDFVSDFVSEKVKAKDALKEMPSAET